MYHTGGKDVMFCGDTLTDVLRIWNDAAISLIDIRHHFISAEEPVRHYRLPASTFVYTGGGCAEVLLNDTPYQTERFGLFHGGAGTVLSIHPADNWLEYYMVLYKVGEPPFHKREFARLLERANPFRQQYGFAPDNPLFFAEQLRKMYERWKGPTPLSLFYAKSAFYQLVYEVYEELDRDEIRILQPEAAVMVKRYLDEHYHEHPSMQAFSQLLGISPSYLRRTFKSKYGVSPQEYLTNLRVEAVKERLLHSDALLKEIADHLGFYDEFQMSRVFKKKEGVSPYAYKTNHTCKIGDAPMAKALPFPYNEEGQVSIDKLKGEGVNFMFTQMRSKAVIAASLSLMLLLSACGTAPSGTSDTESTTSAVTAQTSETGEDATRTVSTVMGDVVIPENPQRIAAFGLPGDLVAIGITPLCGNSEARLFDGILTDETYTYIELDDYEGIMEQSPDLIILSYPPDQDAYDKLSAIAPTVAIDSHSLTMAERIAFMGEITGRQESAAQAMSDFEAKAAACRETLESVGIKDKTITVIEGSYLFGAKYGRGADILYNYLGFTAPEKLQEVFDGGDMYLEISMEVLGEYCGDYILQSVWNGSEDLSDNAVWNSIPAVKNGHVIEIDFSDFFSGDLYISSKQLDYLTEAFLALEQ